MKNVFTVILILISTVSAIVTGIMEHPEDMKIPNVVINSAISLIVGIQKVLQYPERSANFYKYSQNYNKLLHNIDTLIICENLTERDVATVIDTYENITNNITDVFPYHIFNEIKRRYDDLDAEYLPIIFNKFSILTIQNKSTHLENVASSPWKRLRKYLPSFERSPQIKYKLSNTIQTENNKRKKNKIIDTQHTNKKINQSPTTSDANSNSESSRISHIVSPTSKKIDEKNTSLSLDKVEIVCDTQMPTEPQLKQPITPLATPELEPQSLDPKNVVTR
jgi:hypothetical protein